MSLLIHVALAITSIVLIFLSNVDTKVCLIICAIYLYLFAIRNLENRVKVSAWIVGVFVAIASLNAYKINPDSDKHLRRTIQGTKNKNWSKAGENLSKMYTECTHCILKYQDYPDSLKRDSLVLSYNEKSNSYKSMMNVIYKVHKNTREDQLSYVLFKKSANELHGLGDRIKGQNERKVIVNGLQSTELNKAHTTKTGKQKRSITSNSKIINPKLFFKNKDKNKRKSVNKSKNKKRVVASKEKCRESVRLVSQKKSFKRVAKTLH